MELKEIQNEIDKHNKAYWIDNKPLIPDKDFDILIERLKILNPEDKRINKIYTPKINSNKITHIFPMLSLDKKYDKESLIKWCIKLSRDQDEYFEFSPKYDGCSVELRNDILSTRGDDGIEGDNISDKLKYINLSKIKNIEYCRGELIITDTDFIILNNYMSSKGKKPYKNQRNTVGGILSTLELPKDFPVVLTLIPFDDNVIYYKVKDINEILLQKYENFIKTLNFPTDGFVVKILNLAYKEELGYTNHHPKGEIAFKFKNPSGISKLLGVIWSNGKKQITPIGVIDPVNINGITIRKVNLHNLNVIIQKNIKIGSTILIERAGDVIPDVRNVIPMEGEILREIDIPLCPSCGSECEYLNPLIACKNKDCVGTVENNLLYSIIYMGLENIGKPTIKKIIEKFKCNNLIDILKLTKNNFLKLEGFADISAEKLFNEIQKIKTQPMPEWRILASLNIPGFGETLSKLILKEMTLKDIINLDEDLFFEKIMNIPGIGYIRCNVIFQELKDKNNYLLELLSIVLIDNNDCKITSDKTVCMTGKFEEPKNILKKSIEVNTEYQVVSSVNKDLSILLCDDISKQSSKYANALKFGITVMSYEEFKQKYFINNQMNKN